MKQLAQLFISFFKIGAFTFGGGYAMIPLIQREVIENRRWIAEKDFLDLLTVAQSAPGPLSLNTSVFVGYKMRGYAGAVAAITGAVLPSFAIILLIAMFFTDVRDNEVVDAAFKGMRPAVVALIIAPVASLMRGMTPALKVLAVIIGIALWYFAIPPVPVLIAGAAVGIAATLLITRKADKS
ncbi:MAG: chromate transporter [Alistipes sp.]|nr:chromate transporter [Alistipes sp.]